MNLAEIQDMTGGDRHGDAVFSAVSIDTRTLQPDDLFIAIRGPNFDGNCFIDEAATKQACAAIVSQPVETRLPTLCVSDTRLALGKVAAANRANTSACVIALTGSQGKTTVKEMTAGILAGRGRTVMTRGNLNNDYGVPLSLLQIDASHEYAVIELGANGPGEIAYTVDLARPRIAHITNIAGTHLEGFGSLAGVANAKGEIWAGIREGGTAVVNLDDEFAARFCHQVEGRKLVTVSAVGKRQADYRAEGIDLYNLDGASFNLETPVGNIYIELQVAGRHNVANALAAAALAMEAGASLEQVRRGLEKFTPVPGRFNVIRGLQGSIIIDDSYNASPSSFRAAIDVLALKPGTRVVAMGDMGELGVEAENAHRELGEYARQRQVNYFIATGTLSRLAVESFGSGGLYIPARDEMVEQILPLLGPDTTVLVKGSRSQGMEKLVKQLQETGA